MPIRNEAAFIERSFGAILEQDYPSERYEVLIIDGMSDDKTRDLIHSLSESTSVSVRVIDNPQKIVPPAMNLGIRHARGEIIIRMDGHTVAALDYLTKCIEVMENTNADNVGGRMDCVSDSLLGDSIGVATSHPFGIGGAKFHYAKEAQEVDTVYLGCWRKETFQRYGLFDEYFLRTQDSEFNYRTRMLGGKIWLDPKIQSKYHNRASIPKLWKQYLQYGYWKTRLMYKLGGKLKLRHLAAPFLVSGLLISTILSFIGIAIYLNQPELAYIAYAFFFTSMITPVSYVLALSVATLSSIRKSNFKKGVLTFFIFPIIHFSWGSGFLWGLLNRPDSRKFSAIPELSNQRPENTKL